MHSFKKVFLFFSLVLLFTGCEQEVLGPYNIRVRVVNLNGVPVQNVDVRLYAPIGAEGTVNYYNRTDIAGYTSFEYEYTSFLRIDATKSSWKGCAFVELTQQNDLDVVLVIKPFNDSDNGCPPS